VISRRVPAPGVKFSREARKRQRPAHRMELVIPTGGPAGRVQGDPRRPGVWPTFYLCLYDCTSLGANKPDLGRKTA